MYCIVNGGHGVEVQLLVLPKYQQSRGAHYSVFLLVLMSLKRRVRAAHWRVARQKTNFERVIYSEHISLFYCITFLSTQNSSLKVHTVLNQLLSLQLQVQGCKQNARRTFVSISLFWREKNIKKERAPLHEIGQLPQ